LQAAGARSRSPRDGLDTEQLGQPGVDQFLCSAKPLQVVVAEQRATVGLAVCARQGGNGLGNDLECASPLSHSLFAETTTCLKKHELLAVLRWRRGQAQA
jgi:hypothetical protein